MQDQCTYSWTRESRQRAASGNPAITAKPREFMRFSDADDGAEIHLAALVAAPILCSRGGDHRQHLDQRRESDRVNCVDAATW